MILASLASDAGRTPVLPPGRFVWLEGRGRTFVRELPGPEGAPVVVLLHGWSATADLNWFPCFAPLARHFRVLALDHRGHGRGLRALNPFRLEHCADDVAALAQHLGVSRIIPVGYSMGGPIAQLIWKHHRDLVDGLVLCATSCTFSGTRRERMLYGAAAGTSAIAAAAPLARAAVATLTAVSGLRNLGGSRWWGFDEVARHDWKQVIEAGRALGRFDSRQWITDVAVPTAVLVTGDDEVVPARRQLALAAAIRGATVLTMPGGHCDCTLAPELFVTQLVDACLEVAKRSSSTTAAASGSRSGAAATAA